MFKFGIRLVIPQLRVALVVNYLPTSARVLFPGDHFHLSFSFCFFSIWWPLICYITLYFLLVLFLFYFNTFSFHSIIFEDFGSNFNLLFCNITINSPIFLFGLSLISLRTFFSIFLESSYQLFTIIFTLSFYLPWPTTLTSIVNTINWR